MKIIKVSMSKESKEDYLDLVGEEMDEKLSKSIIDNVFTYLQIKNITRDVFKVKYYDENINRMLYIFVMKTSETVTHYLKVINWSIAGICFENERIIKEMEEEGLIRIWLKSYLL